MANVFTSIPVRSNANRETVDASWWNAIRTALVSYIGAGGVDETQFTIAGSQSSYQNVTGLLFDASVTRSLEVPYTIYRDDGTASRRESGILRTHYKAREGTWYYERVSWGDDALGNGTVSNPLIVNSSGQVQYKSDNFASGTIRYKAVVSFLKET